MCRRVSVGTWLGRDRRPDDGRRHGLLDASSGGSMCCPGEGDTDRCCRLLHPKDATLKSHPKTLSDSMEETGSRLCRATRSQFSSLALCLRTKFSALSIFFLVDIGPRLDMRGWRRFVGATVHDQCLVAKSMSLRSVLFCYVFFEYRVSQDICTIDQYLHSQGIIVSFQ